MRRASPPGQLLESFVCVRTLGRTFGVTVPARTDATDSLTSCRGETTGQKEILQSQYLSLKPRRNGWHNAHPNAFEPGGRIAGSIYHYFICYHIHAPRTQAA